MYYFSNEKGFQLPDLHAGQIPDDAAIVSQKQHHDLLIAQMRGCVIVKNPDGTVVAQEPLPPTVAAIRTRYSNSTSLMIDNQARALNYDDQKDIMSFLGDPNPVFDAEAQHFRLWRSRVWTEFEARFANEVPTDMELSSVSAWVATLPTYEAVGLQVQPITETETEEE